MLRLAHLLLALLMAVPVWHANAQNKEAAQPFSALNPQGKMLWGKGQAEANKGNVAESVRLFAEASRLIGYDLDFSVDHARALSLAGVKLGDKKMLDEAFSRFAQIHARAPQHTLNLQNWAIALYYTGKYGPAWEKIKAAQATPRGAEVDKKFLSDLQAKMPRP